MLKCGQEKCANAANYRYQWLGEYHFICEECRPMLENIASALGMGVILEPLQPEPEHVCEKEK
jgi:hypothetical protein